MGKFKSQWWLAECQNGVLFDVGMNEQLLKIFERSGLSGYALARLSGVSEMAIYRWANGDTIPNVETFQKLVDGLNVQVTMKVKP